MTLQAAMSAPIPISLSHGGVYRLDGVQYCLTNGAGGLMAFLANFGTEPAIVTSTLASAGWLVIVPGDAYAIGWDGAAWRALRMVDARVPASEDLPSKVRFTPRQLPAMDDTSADTSALVCRGSWSRRWTAPQRSHRSQQSRLSSPARCRRWPGRNLLPQGVPEMSRFVFKVAQPPPFLGSGFVLDPVTGLLDVASIAPQPLTGAILSTDAVLISRNIGTVAVPNWQPFYATPAQVQALAGSSSSASATPTPTSPAYTFSVSGDNFAPSGFEMLFNVFEPNGTRITPSALPTSNWTVSLGWSKSSTVAPKVGDPLFYSATWNTYQSGAWDGTASGYPFGNAGAVTGDVYYPWAVTSDGATFCFTSNSHSAP